MPAQSHSPDQVFRSQHTDVTYERGGGFFCLEKVRTKKSFTAECENVRLLRKKCFSLQNMSVLVSVTQLDQHGKLCQLWFL